MNLDYYLLQEKSTPYSTWPGHTKENYLQFFRNQLDLDNNSETEVFNYSTDTHYYCFIQVENQEWDSSHFGFKCARIKHIYLNEFLSIEEINELCEKVISDLLKYLKFKNYKFVFVDINSNSPILNYFIQRIGFKFIVNWIDGYLPSNQIQGKIIEKNVLINSNEVDDIASISMNHYYKGGRFYSDRNFNPFFVDKMYHDIVINSYNNNDIIVVERDKIKPIGAFISKPIKIYREFNNLRVAHLRFLVMDPNYRGRDIGYKLFSKMLELLSTQCDLIVTGLETNNHISLNLHNKFGFKFNYTHNAYHLWI